MASEDLLEAGGAPMMVDLMYIAVDLVLVEVLATPGIHSLASLKASHATNSRWGAPSCGRFGWQ